VIGMFGGQGKTLILLGGVLVVIGEEDLHPKSQVFKGNSFVVPMDPHQ